jgi:hypothetical protein
MNRIKCPHCSEDTFSFWGKLCIGPARTVKCKGCGQTVGVSTSAWVAVLIGTAGFAGGLLFDVVPIKVIVFILGWGICAYLYAHHVSLVAKSK